MYILINYNQIFKIVVRKFYDYLCKPLFMDKITHNICGGIIDTGKYKTYYTKEELVSWDDGRGGGDSYKEHKSYGFCPICGERLNPNKDTAKTDRNI